MFCLALAAYIVASTVPSPPFVRVTYRDKYYPENKHLLSASLRVADTLGAWEWSRRIDNIAEKYIPIGMNVEDAKIFLFDNGFILKNQGATNFVSTYEHDTYVSLLSREGREIVISVVFSGDKILSVSEMITAGSWLINDKKENGNIHFLTELNQKERLWKNKLLNLDALAKRYFPVGMSVRQAKIILFDNGFQGWNPTNSKLVAHFEKTGFTDSGVPLRYRFYLKFEFEKGEVASVSGELQTTAS
jgi:hypothetical protein